MTRVIVESPYHGDTSVEIIDNIKYGRACLRDSLSRGEAPFASHLFYTQPGVLRDAVGEECWQGMEAGWAWMAAADLVVFYVDRGLSPGMKDGLDRALMLDLPIEFRRLPKLLTGTPVAVSSRPEATCSDEPETKDITALKAT